MKRVIIDTNAFLAIFTKGIDLFFAIDNACDFEYELYVLEGTMDELTKICDTAKGKDKAAAQLGLAILKQKIGASEVMVLPSSGHVDDELVRESKDGAIVLTMDKALKKRLSSPYLTVRQGKYVVMK
tara:strand:+ start:809 stop:1189 length:381 start_codon:yes stop_codon:yes gene_type:complete